MKRRSLIWGLAWSLLVAGCGPSESTSPTTTGAGGGGNGGSGGTGGEGGSGGTTIATTTTTTTDPRFDALIAAIEAEREELGAPGVAVAVLEDGKVTFARGFGSKDPNAGVPVEATTLFRIGSVNKMLTAAAVLGQVGKGNVDLAAPVTDHVPGFDFSTDPTWGPSIQVRHLLTHASGMVDYLDMTVPASQKEDAALHTFLTGSWGNIGYLMVPSGTFWNYSNPNFYVAGLVAEQTAGKPYRQVMKEDVFTPLGMDRTFFLASEVLADGDYALGKSAYPGIPEVVLPDSYENAWARPAGFAFSSVLDLSKFAAFLLDGNAAVMPDALREEMTSAQIDSQVLLDLVHYGYGVQIFNGVFLGGTDKFYQMKIVEHGGDIPGFAADVTLVPSLRFGFITLANADGAHFTNSLVTALTTLAPLPSTSPPPDLTADPATFGAFEGVYQDDFNVGEIIVTKVGNDLQVNMPLVDEAGVPYDKVLIPSAENNFYLAIQGTYLQVTFIKDGAGEMRYFRTRAFVGVRPEEPPPPPPAPAILSPEGRTHFLHSVQRARPTAAERLLRPKI